MFFFIALIALLLTVLVAVLVAALLTFDQIVRLEYSAHRSRWEKDGKPHGFSWVPPESRMLRGWMVRPGSFLALNRLAFVWLFKAPEWIQGDQRAIGLVRRLRILVLIWNIGLIGVLIFVVQLVL